MKMPNTRIQGITR